MPDPDPQTTLRNPIELHWEVANEFGNENADEVCIAAFSVGDDRWWIIAKKIARTVAEHICIVHNQAMEVERGRI